MGVGGPVKWSTRRVGRIRLVRWLDGCTDALVAKMPAEKKNYQETEKLLNTKSENVGATCKSEYCRTGDEVLAKAKADPSLGNKEWGMENTAVHEVRARCAAKIRGNKAFQRGSRADAAALLGLLPSWLTELRQPPATALSTLHFRSFWSVVIVLC